MSSWRPKALTPGRSAPPAPHDPAREEQQLEELLHGIDAAQRQIDGVLSVLHDLAISVRDRPRRGLPQGPGGSSRPERADGDRRGATTGMRGWGH